MTSTLDVKQWGSLTLSDPVAQKPGREEDRAALCLLVPGLCAGGQEKLAHTGFPCSDHGSHKLAAQPKLMP